MRDYGSVAPEFWTGDTGRALRGHPEAQIVALYLVTAPLSNMIGVFLCPITSIAHDTGLPIEGASKGLARIIKAGFCTYSKTHEIVWVREMARFQIAGELKLADHRVKHVRKLFDKIPDKLIKQAFFKKYRAAFHLDHNDIVSLLEAPSKAPPKPGTGAGAGTGADKSRSTSPFQKQIIRLTNSIDANPDKITRASPAPTLAALGVHLRSRFVVIKRGRSTPPALFTPKTGAGS